MGRVSTFSDLSIYDAIGEQLASNATVTLRDVVSHTGVSIGSLYHRFGSREGMLAHAWLDAVQDFQTGFLAELASGRPNAGERAAMATPKFCRDKPARARILVCCRREEFMSADTPAALSAQIETANSEVSKKVIEFARARGYALEACQLGLVGFPLGAVRLYLPHRKVPKRIDAYVAAAFKSAVGVVG